MRGKIALIVGGTTGIGRATAELLCQHGAIVVIAGRDKQSGSRTAAELSTAGNNCSYVTADVTSADSVAKLIQSVTATHGRLDIAFNNAGRESPYQRTADIDEAEFQSMLNVKLTGLWRCMKFELQQMVKQGGGVIVNMAGNWGLKAAPGFAAYCAAAHGIMGLTRSAAQEYAKENIRVNAVCPGAVDTDLLDRMVGGSMDMKKSLAAAVPMGRIATPRDVAGAVAWLCSDESSYITAQGIVLAGGE